MAIPDLQQCPLQLNLIKDVEDNVVLLTLFDSNIFSIVSCASQVYREPTDENKQLKITKNINI